MNACVFWAKIVNLKVVLEEKSENQKERDYSPEQQYWIKCQSHGCWNSPDSKWWKDKQTAGWLVRPTHNRAAIMAERSGKRTKSVREKRSNSAIGSNIYVARATPCCETSLPHSVEFHIVHLNGTAAISLRAQTCFTHSWPLSFSSLTLPCLPVWLSLSKLYVTHANTHKTANTHTSLEKLHKTAMKSRTVP